VQLKAVSKVEGMLPMPEVVLWRLEAYKYIDAKTGQYIAHPYVECH
jgi:hypothetical protein